MQFYVLFNSISFISGRWADDKVVCNGTPFTSRTVETEKNDVVFFRSSMIRIYTMCKGGGRVVRWCWVNFHCRGVLLIWTTVGQGPTALALGVGWGCLDISSLVYHFSFLSPSLWETARYRLKYCLKGPLSPKQPTNQPCAKRKL